MSLVLTRRFTRLQRRALECLRPTDSRFYIVIAALVGGDGGVCLEKHALTTNSSRRSASVVCNTVPRPLLFLLGRITSMHRLPGWFGMSRRSLQLEVCTLSPAECELLCCPATRRYLVWPEYLFRSKSVEATNPSVSPWSAGVLQYTVCVVSLRCCPFVHVAWLSGAVGEPESIGSLERCTSFFSNGWLLLKCTPRQNVAVVEYGGLQGGLFAA